MITNDVERGLPDEISGEMPSHENMRKIIQRVRQKAKFKYPKVSMKDVVLGEELQNLPPPVLLDGALPSQDSPASRLFLIEDFGMYISQFRSD